MKKLNNIVNFKFLLGFLLLYGLVAFCYSPVFSNGFLDSWDDQWMVMNIFTESGFRMENLIAVFTQSYKGQYSPLVELNYMVLYGLFGYDPFWFHLMSFVWHCGCATLLFFLDFPFVGDVRPIRISSKFVGGCLDYLPFCHSSGECRIYCLDQCGEGSDVCIFLFVNLVVVSSLCPVTKTRLLYSSFMLFCLFVFE